MTAALVSLLASVPPPAASGGDDSFWMPVRGSANAGDVDWLFNFIFGLSLFFFALIVFLMVWFVLRYRRRTPDDAVGPATHNTTLEVVWTVIPICLVMAIFYFGFSGYMHSVVAPENGYDVQVSGQKWKWSFTYPNGYVDENLHIPVGMPVRLTLSSEDVIHSLYIPAFRLKKDAVPGRYTKMWFTATQTGEFQIFCAEYCGTSHSDMLAKVVVHEPAEFEKWLEKASNFLERMPPAEAGKKLYEVRGCRQCHTPDGTPLIGPTFKGLWGKTQPLTDGQSVVVDENFIRESIVEPQAKIAAGFDPVMPTYKGRLKDKEIGAIIEYIKTLK